MKQYLISLKKVVYVSSMIFAGIIMFITFSAIGINNSVLTPNFHHQLFIKNDVYTHTYNVIKNSMDGFIEDFKNHSPKDYDQHKDIFILLQNSITQEMVSTNLDNIRDQAFLYFSGKRMLLPDIYLEKPSGFEHEKAFASSGKKDENSKLSADTISQIEKVNLSAILIYINRNDIADQFVLIKLLYYILNSLPGISIPIFLCLLFLALLSSSGTQQVSKWLFKTFIISGALMLISGIVLLLYSWILLPANIGFIELSVPIKAEIIISYIRDCTVDFALFLLFSSIIACIFAFFLLRALKRLPSIIFSRSKFQIQPNSKLAKVFLAAKYFSIFLAFSLSLCAVSINAYDFKSGYESNDFPAFIEKYSSTSKVTQVISAKDDTIYGLQIKLVDPDNNLPIANTTINITGKSNLLDKHFNESVTTDYSGIAKFILDKGTFRFSIFQSGFPEEYQTPSPFYFDLKTAGTTIITVHTYKKPESERQTWGVSEIEVLDKENKPVPDIKLSINSKVFAPGNPDYVSSFSNSEGIAVFKLNEGNYSAEFSKEFLPKKYILPPPVKLDITRNAISRYTVRLADVKQN